MYSTNVCIHIGAALRTTRYAVTGLSAEYLVTRKWHRLARRPRSVGGEPILVTRYSVIRIRLPGKIAPYRFALRRVG